MFEFQFSYFTRGQFIDNAPVSISPIMMAFENKFLPSYADEISPHGLRKVIRIVGINEFDGVAVLFSSESVNINMLYRDYKPKEEEVFARLDFIINALSKINSNIKVWRLASIVTSVERVTYENSERMYSKFFADGAHNDFFEWNVRRAKKEQYESEVLNVVATISRGPVTNTINPTENFDAVIVQLDVNTAAEKTTDRFNISRDIIFHLTDKARKNLEHLLG